MKEKVLYLIGAGASAQALPLVKGSSDGTVQGLANALYGLTIRLQNEHPHEGFSGHFIKYIKTRFKWLQDESNNHETIDTYAHSLYVRGDDKKLKELKLSLAIFFVLQQIHLKKLDKRYYIWLSSILPKTTLFPDNIRILTWNYDFQMQLAAESIRKEEFHYSDKVFVSKPPIVKYYPPMGNIFPHTTPDYNPLDFSLIHLNGIAGLFLEKSKNYFDNIFVTQETIIDALENFINRPDDYTHLLTFAWEENSSESSQIKRRLEFAKSIVKDTSILCVIGYSFPRFNKPVDTEIFNILNQSSRFRKIYIQDPYSEQYKPQIYNHFRVDKSIVEIECITQTDTFHIPYEL